MATPLRCLLAALFLAAVPAAQAGAVVHEQLGVKWRPPAGWSHVGRDGDRGSLRAMFVSPRELAPKSSETALPHTPVIRLLEFPSGGAVPAAAAGELPRRTPFTGFADYQQRGTPPGYAVTHTEDGRIGNLACRWIDARAPREEGPLAFRTCLLTLDGSDLAIELEVLADFADRTAKDFDKAVKSLTAVPRAAAEAAPPPMPGADDREAWRRLAVTERAEQRRRWGDAWVAAREKVAEPGYRSQRAGPYLVLSRADAAFTKRVAAAAQTIRSWVERRFEEVSDEAVMPAVIRVFATRQEHDAYRAREFDARAYDPERREIYFFKDADVGNTGEGFGTLGWGISDQFLDDKDPAIVRHLPRWLDFGLVELLRSTRVKGKDLELFAGEVEMGRLRYHRQNDSLPHLWALVQESIVTTPDDGAEEPPWGYTPECTRLLRWLDAGRQQADGPRRPAARLRPRGRPDRRRRAGRPDAGDRLGPPDRPPATRPAQGAVRLARRRAQADQRRRLPVGGRGVEHRRGVLEGLQREVQVTPRAPDRGRG